MRIAVAQLAVEPAKRTLTFQRALQAIDAAAETDPAPDLIVLPAFCDVLSIRSGNSEIIERRAGPTVAACGLRARQWGVFVALGLAERGPERPYVTGVLLDNDGDLCLAHRQGVSYSNGDECFASADDVSVTEVLLGRLAILTGDEVLDDRAWEGAVGDGAALVLGIGCWAARQDEPAPEVAEFRRQTAELAGRYGVCCAVADVTTASAALPWNCPGMSMIVDAGGNVLAAAETKQASTLWADLTLSKPPASEVEDH
jgi:predicted amidohydrolase